MEDNYTERFATFYEEYADTYQDDLELALSDFKGFEGYEGTEDDYAFFDTVKSVASKAGSAVKAGAKVAASTVKSVGTKVASGTGSALKTASKVTGVTSLANTAKNAATGAVVGAGVNAVRGKSIAKGAVAGAAINTVGRAAVNTVGNGAKGLYNKAKENFSDEDYADMKRDAFLNSKGTQENTYSLSDKAKRNLKVGGAAVAGGAVGAGIQLGAHKLDAYVLNKKISKLEAKKASNGGKLNEGESGILAYYKSKLARNKKYKSAFVAGTGLVYGAIAGAGMKGSLDRKAKTKLIETNNSSEDLDFVEFYSEMEDIYKDNMDEAYADFEAIYLNDDFSLKSAGARVEQIALGTKAGRALTGAVAGGVLAQGLTSVGAEASMRRQLKKKLYNGTISKNERVQLERLIDKRDKTKKWSARAGGVVGLLS